MVEGTELYDQQFASGRPQLLLGDADSSGGWRSVPITVQKLPTFFFTRFCYLRIEPAANQ